MVWKLQKNKHNYQSPVHPLNGIVTVKNIGDLFSVIILGKRKKEREPVTLMSDIRGTDRRFRFQ